MTSRNVSVDPFVRWLGRVPWAALGIGVVLAGSVRAQEASIGGGDRVPSRQHQRALQQAWPALKTLELEKLASLQSLNSATEQCIRQVNSLDGWLSCQRQEHQAHQSLHARLRSQHEAIRQRYGLAELKPHPGKAGYDGEQEPSAR